MAGSCESPEEALADLDRHCADGEGQAIEFKREFPHQARDLAKEIAAFGSTNPGTIYIGVDDNGGVIGLDASAGTDDELRRRVSGLHTVIKPALRTDISFVAHPNGKVMRIIVPKGNKPMYYVDQRPYLRDDTEARPAEPDEVEEAHERYFKATHLPGDSGPHELPAEQQEAQDYLGSVVMNAAAVAGASDAVEVRFSNPHLESLQYLLDDLGVEARRLSEMAETHSFAPFAEPLARLGRQLAAVGEHQWFMGRECWEEWLAKVRASAETANEIILMAPQLARVPPELRRQIYGELSGLAAEVQQQSQEYSHLERVRGTSGLQVALGGLGDRVAVYAHLLDLWDKHETEAVQSLVQQFAGVLREAESADQWRLEKSVEVVTEVANQVRQVLSEQNGAAG